MFRAILEGIAFEQRLQLEGLDEALEHPVEALYVMGGGSRGPLWRQIVADITRRPVIACREVETTVAARAMDPTSTRRAAMTGCSRCTARSTRAPRHCSGSCELRFRIDGCSGSRGGAGSSSTRPSVSWPIRIPWRSMRCGGSLAGKHAPGALRELAQLGESLVML
jgi:hypothetical protein